MRELDQKNRLCEQIHIPKRAKNDIDFIKESNFTIIIHQILSYYSRIDLFVGSLIEERNRRRSMATFSGLHRVTENVLYFKLLFKTILFAAHIFSHCTYFFE